MKRCPKLDIKQKQELKSFIQSSKDSKEIRRSQSVLLVDRAADYGTIHSVTRFKERSVLIFRQRYLKYGIKGPKHRRKGKPKSLLTKSQREEMINFLTNTSPKNHGYEADFWSSAIFPDRLLNILSKILLNFYV